MSHSSLSLWDEGADFLQKNLQILFLRNRLFRGTHLMG